MLQKFHGLKSSAASINQLPVIKALRTFTVQPVNYCCVLHSSNFPLVLSPWRMNYQKGVWLPDSWMKSHTVSSFLFSPSNGFNFLMFLHHAIEFSLWGTSNCCPPPPLRPPFLCDENKIKFSSRCRLGIAEGLKCLAGKVGDNVCNYVWRAAGVRNHAGMAFLLQHIQQPPSYNHSAHST